MKRRPSRERPQPRRAVTPTPVRQPDGISFNWRPFEMVFGPPKRVPFLDLGERHEQR
jgi:hypothetical protein